MAKKGRPKKNNDQGKSGNENADQIANMQQSIAALTDIVTNLANNVQNIPPAPTTDVAKKEDVKPVKDPKLNYCKSCEDRGKLSPMSNRGNDTLVCNKCSTWMPDPKWIPQVPPGQNESVEMKRDRLMRELNSLPPSILGQQVQAPQVQYIQQPIPANPPVAPTQSLLPAQPVTKEDSVVTKETTEKPAPKFDVPEFKDEVPGTAKSDAEKPIAPPK